MGERQRLTIARLILARRLTRVTGHLAFRGDGLEAAVVADGRIVAWDLDPEHWVEYACDIAGRNRTRAEWTKYVGDLAPYDRTCTEFPEG
jgi:hypothetical protein